MICIGLVDDHVLLRNGLAALVNSFPGCKVVFEAGNGKELMQKLKPKSPPDVVLMDITMPVMDGYAATKWLSVNHPTVKVLALSMLDDEQAIIRMLHHGAKGFILKDCEPIELQLAISAVANKGFYHSELVSGKIMQSMQNGGGVNAAAKPTVVFTDREMELLLLACTEKPYREIAEEMGISQRTVEGYCDNLYQKTGVKTRIGLVIYAIKNGLLEL